MPNRLIVFAVIASAGLGCGGEATGPPPAEGADVALSFQNLRALDAATEGRYQVWFVDGAGARHPGGTIDPTGTATVRLPITGPQSIEITVEPPGDADATPSAQLLLRGDFSGARADLTVEGALTQGRLALQRTPGQFTMFSPSDNQANGYPSHEESGVWLFNMAPRDTPQNDMWVRLAQLRAGWTYEGWMVRDYGTPQAIWLSYGKFVPDQSGAINTRDDTGWGPFSGVVDFRTEGEEEFPGDDWISNPLDFPFPPELQLPLNLRETDGQGAFRWTHVISIEPSSNRGESVSTERPFVTIPYRDAFGGGAPGDPRTITYRAEGVPSGTAIVK